MLCVKKLLSWLVTYLALNCLPEISQMVGMFGVMRLIKWNKKQFFLRSNQVRLNCIEFIKELPTDDKKPLVVKIQPMTRSLEQKFKTARTTKRH